MQTISGLIILFGLFVLGRAGYETYKGVEDAWSTGVVGLFLLGLGIYLAGRPRKPAPDIPNPVEAVAEAISPKVPDEPKEAIFSIIQTGDDDVVDRAEALLAGFRGVRSVVSETGQWYSTPDRDDLPEWNALRVYCDAKEVDKVMEDVSNHIKDKLGVKALNKLTIQRYS